MANVDATGKVVVSRDTGVIVPGSIAGPTTVVAHSLTDGAELWRYTFRHFPTVIPDRSGFLLADGQTQVWTLVDAHTRHAAWSAHLRRTGTLRQSPRLTAAGAVFVIQEQTSVAFVDHATGYVRRLVVESGEGTAAAAGSGSYVLAGTRIRRVSPEHVVWTRDLPQYPSQPPATLTDGGVAALTRDPICLGNLDLPGFESAEEMAQGVSAQIWERRVRRVRTRSRQGATSCRNRQRSVKPGGPSTTTRPQPDLARATT